MSSRILGRRFPLNKAETVYLDVGITIIPEPHVSVALVGGQGLARDKEILLSEDAWEKLHDLKTCVLRFLLHSSNEKPSGGSIISLDGNVNVKFGSVEEQGAICIAVADKEIIILNETCQTLMRLNEAVRGKIIELKTVLPMVKSRLNTFVNIVRNLENRYQAYDAISSHSKFRKMSQVDNELAVLALGDIIKLAQPDIVLDVEETFTLAE